MGKPLAASERSDYRALWQPDRVAMAKSPDISGDRASAAS
jgi:hypothetical protein